LGLWCFTEIQSNRQKRSRGVHRQGRVI